MKNANTNPSLAHHVIPKARPPDATRFESVAPTQDAAIPDNIANAYNLLLDSISKQRSDDQSRALQYKKQRDEARLATQAAEVRLKNALKKLQNVEEENRLVLERERQNLKEGIQVERRSTLEDARRAMASAEKILEEERKKIEREMQRLILQPDTATINETTMASASQSATNLRSENPTNRQLTKQVEELTQKLEMLELLKDERISLSEEIKELTMKLEESRSTVKSLDEDKTSAVSEREKLVSSFRSERARWSEKERELVEEMKQLEEALEGAEMELQMFRKSRTLDTQRSGGEHSNAQAGSKRKHHSSAVDTDESSFEPSSEEEEEPPANKRVKKHTTAGEESDTDYSNENQLVDELSCLHCYNTNRSQCVFQERRFKDGRVRTSAAPMRCTECVRSKRRCQVGIVVDRRRTKEPAIRAFLIRTIEEWERLIQ